MASDCPKRISLGEDLYIQSELALTQMPYDKQAQVLLGTLESKYITDSELFISKATSIVPNGELDELDRLMGLANIFLWCLWSQIDHAAYAEQAFLFFRYRDHWVCAKNFRPIFCAKSDGSQGASTVTLKAIKEASALFRIIAKGGEATKYEVTALRSDNTRISRAIYTIQRAIQNHDLAMRVADVCNVLEILLSSTHGEISHQIAERCALIVGRSSEEKISIYRNMKQIYAIRSRVVHGGTWKEKNLDDIRRYSKMSDDILRYVFLACLTNDKLYKALSSSDGALDEYFLTLLFRK